MRTDAHQYDGRIDTPFPRVPGHDFSGRVAAVGDGVDDSCVVVPVAVKPSLPCGDCPECSTDKPFDCRRKKLIGLWSDGCLTERITVPVVNLIPRPEGVEAWQAALLEPIAVGLNTVDRLRLLLGETVVVLGQGPIGLAMTRLYALSGAGRLIVADAREAPFAVSRSYGASDWLDVTQVDPVQETSRSPAARVPTPSSRPAASRPRPRSCWTACARRGRSRTSGWANDLPPLPVIPIMAKTLTVFGIGGNGGRGQYERSLELVRSRRLDLAPMVTHRFGLDEVAEAFEVAAGKSEEPIKVVVDP